MSTMPLPSLIVFFISALFFRIKRKRNLQILKTLENNAGFWLNKIIYVKPVKYKTFWRKKEYAMDPVHGKKHFFNGIRTSPNNKCFIEIAFVLVEDSYLMKTRIYVPADLMDNFSQPH